MHNNITKQTRLDFWLFIFCAFCAYAISLVSLLTFIFLTNFQDIGWLYLFVWLVPMIAAYFFKENRFVYLTVFSPSIFLMLFGLFFRPFLYYYL